MTKIIENFLVPLFVIISILYVFNSFGKQDILLHKAYHHTTQNQLCLERANISFYFSSDPEIQEIKNKTNSELESFSFFFPKAAINQGECQEMVNRLNQQNDCYTIQMTEVVEPTKGIMLGFVINPNKLALSYERFDSIGLQKGIVFRLYNKDLLKKIEQVINNQPVLRTLWHTNKPCIAIDPGHGGRDCGAIGQLGVKEKEVCLAISNNVANLLEQHGFSVVMTRTHDYGVLLDERTGYANNKGADLFVSIHANYASNSRAIGVETFCLQPSLLKSDFSQLSMQENNRISFMRNQRAYCSEMLAQSVQRNVCNAILPFHEELIDRKVKHSVSQVLLATQMPGILIEVGFVSHPRESILLNNSSYQNCIARGIYNGILKAIEC